jgi:hypothetical protein
MMVAAEARTSAAVTVRSVEPAPVRCDTYLVKG